MARTAPTVSGTPVLKQVSLRWIDVSGDKRADSYTFFPAATDAQIEAFAAAMGAGSNANLYEVVVQDAYSDLPDANDATNATKESLFDNIVILAKNALKQTDDLFIPAPIAAMLIDNGAGDSDEIDPTSVALNDIITAFMALRNVGAAATYEVVSGRYTERKEVNKKVNF